ncbi:cytochrome P450 94A1-like protein [Tanacetum coccineum]
MEDVVVIANDLCSSKIQTVSVDFSKTLDSNPHELILLQKGNLVEIDMVISFILAGRDTTLAALTWFFWLICKNAEVENEVVKEIEVKSNTQLYDEVKEMVYTHASVCESMRLYPPIPSEPKTTSADDVLPNGSAVKKGMSLLLYVCIKIDDKIGIGVIGCILDGVPAGAMVGEE